MVRSFEAEFLGIPLGLAPNEQALGLELRPGGCLNASLPPAFRAREQLEARTSTGRESNTRREAG